jgi:hypothetical protein
VHKMVKHMQVLQHFLTGTTLFTAPTATGRQTMPPCPFPVTVYYDPPLVTATATQAHSGQLSMLFSGTIDAVPATVLLDSGASHSFVNYDVAQALGLHMHSSAGSITTADSHATPIAGVCTCKIQIQQHSSIVDLYACKLNDSFQVVLGDDWLQKHKAYLDFADRTCVLRHGSKKLTLVAPTTVPKLSDAPNLLLSSTQLKSAVRHGAEVYVVMLHRQSETQTNIQLNAYQVGDYGKSAR